jgi:tetratricopeptide (TPR) repeat protein
VRPSVPGGWIVASLLLAACASPLDRGEALYRQGDLRGALEVWSDAEYDPVIEKRINEVNEQFDRRLRRYEKRAVFYEEQERLAEAILYYRLALKLDPERAGILAHVQRLARVLETRTAEERASLAAALAEGKLWRASAHAQRLETLNPFDPGVQIEARQVRAEVGAEVLRHLELGRQQYAAGDREIARREFETVLGLDEGNQVALGYLAYIRRFEDLEARTPPPSSIPQEAILSEGHYRAARAARDQGDDFRALQEYEAALRVNREHASARRERDQLRGELSPQVEELYEIGIRYFQDEDLHHALRVWRQVLLIDPKHDRTRENVARAERILSRLEELQAGES